MPRCLDARGERLLEVPLGDLAPGVAGEGVDDRDRLRALERGEILLAQCFELRDIDVLAGLKLYDGVYRLAPVLVGHAHDGRVTDGWVGGEAPLDLGGRDA